ncbi:hypothetical protein ADK54_34810 [Streptomyces sp. WM6378]|nr:hypothetical protein ADK54_34810 [Streptomyces sp. WM6378]
MVSLAGVRRSGMRPQFVSMVVSAEAVGGFLDGLDGLVGGQDHLSFDVAQAGDGAGAAARIALVSPGRQAALKPERADHPARCGSRQSPREALHDYPEQVIGFAETHRHFRDRTCPTAPGAHRQALEPIIDILTPIRRTYAVTALMTAVRRR